MQLKLPTRLGRPILCTHTRPNQGYLEMMEHEQTVKVCAGDAQPAEMKAFYARQQDPPQVRSCVFVMWYCLFGRERGPLLGVDS